MGACRFGLKMPIIDIGNGLLKITNDNSSCGLFFNLNFEAQGLVKDLQSMLDVRNLFKDMTFKYNFYASARISVLWDLLDVRLKLRLDEKGFEC